MDKKELNNLSTGDLIRLSENDFIRFKDDRYKIYAVAGIKFKELGKIDRYNDMKREYKAFHYPLRYSTKYESLPIRNSFSEEDIDYYKYRAKKTLNPILKARYCDLIYGYNNKNYRYAYCSIEAHINCSQIYFDNAWDLELADSLKQAISSSYKLKNYNLFMKSAHKHNLIIFRLVNENRFGFSLLQIIQNLLDYEKKLKELSYPINHIFISEIIEIALSHMKKTKVSFHIQRAFMELLLNILKHEPEKKVNLVIRIAKSYEDEGDLITSQSLNDGYKASHFYQKALNSYKKLPNSPEPMKNFKKQKINESLIKLQKSNKIAIENTNTIQYDFKDIWGDDFHEKITKQLKKYENKEPIEFFRILSSDNSLPTVSNARLFEEYYSKESVFQKILPSHLMHSDLHTKHIPSENREYNVKKFFVNIFMPYLNIILNKVFELLNSENGHFSNDLTVFLSISDLINNQRIEIIKHGFESFEQKEYVAGIHILIFQIEGILRDICEKIGFPTIKYLNDNEIRAIMPGDMIEKLYNVGIDKDILDLIQIFLYDTEGYNYRNGVAHGLYDINAFTKENAILLIFILIKLAPYKFVEPEVK